MGADRGRSSPRSASPTMRRASSATWSSSSCRRSAPSSTKGKEAGGRRVREGGERGLCADQRRGASRSTPRSSDDARAWSTRTPTATAGSSSSTHRRPERARRPDGRGRLRRLTSKGLGRPMMRYLPLTDDRPPRDAGDDRRRPRSSALFATCPAGACLEGRPVEPAAARRASSAVERAPGRMAAKNLAAGSVPFFLGAGAYRHHVPASGRSPDPARRVPDLLHALPARDRAGHAADAVRVPDPGGAAHRHGCGQRLDVRRLHRDCAEAVMMAHRVTSAEKRVLSRRPAPALPRRRRRPRAHHRLRRSLRAAATRAAREDAGGDDRRRDLPASSCRTPTSSAMCAIYARCRRGRACQGRAADRGRDRDRCRSGAISRRARWAPTSSWPRASRSATRSASAGPMSACSPRATSSCARCRAASAGETVDADGKRGLRADALDPRAAYPPREGDLATSAPTRASARSPSPST